MTTPQPPPQQQVPPGPPPTPPQSDAAQDIALVTAISELLLTAASAAVMIAALKLRFKLSAELWQGLQGSAGVAMAQPPPLTGIVGAASAQTSRQNLIRRAQFVLSAGRRLAGDIVQARAQGKPVRTALADGLARERRYYSQDTAAIWQRATAAGKIDIEAATHGLLLGWYAKHDKRVTAECLRADRHNFYVTDPPDIGLPGIGPHVGCRCEAGPPWPGGGCCRAGARDMRGQRELA